MKLIVSEQEYDGYGDSNFTVSDLVTSWEEVIPKEVKATQFVKA